MKIALASDHAGYQLKEGLKSYLSNFDVIDFGTDSPQSMDYPDTGFAAAEAVGKGECDKGILICGTGIGMSIVANKVIGVRAALCTSVTIAKLSREHNDANVLILPGRFMKIDEAKKIVDTWFSTEFDGGRHIRRLNKIKKYEDRR
ncbi:MAG TPA: ribose 5-phosphate isomerase B [Candidatus Cloacimonetes bacterium]|nr:ribose 5-phosphate isomerase B [Candidatus Cloacimonadota bacterium]HEX38272.1 ribose 5-phosphate isomerase B [Candidatus Cloacimonadota bacterium]